MSLEDGSAEAAAVLVLDELGLAGGGDGVVEVIFSVGGVVADEVVGGAVPLVGAAAGDGVDEGPGGGTELGGVIGGLDGELLEGVERRADHVALLVIEAAEIVNVAGSVEEKGVLETVIAVGDEAVVASGGLGDDAGDEVGGLDIVAAVEGNVGKFFGFDDLLDGLGLVLDEGSFAGDGNGLGGLADLQCWRERDGSSHLNVDGTLLKGLEALSGNVYVVAAGGGRGGLRRCLARSSAAGEALRRCRIRLQSRLLRVRPRQSYP